MLLIYGWTEIFTDIWTVLIWQSLTFAVVFAAANGGLPLILNLGVWYTFGDRKNENNTRQSWHTCNAISVSFCRRAA